MNKRLAIIGAFVLGALVLVTYQPSFRMGFYLDDYYHIERAGRIAWADALRQIFDPRAQTLWYRPLQGLQFFIEYQIFGGNSNAYHLVNIFYHVINVWLLYALVWRVSQRWRLGFITALFYATFSVYISGVTWLGEVEPLLSVFYLASVGLWWLYLENQRARFYWLALAALALALMAKQTALTLPVIFFLMERWLAYRPSALVDLIRRYIPFGLVAGVFALVQFFAPTTAVFTGQFDWKPGTTMLSILWEYMVLLFEPWGVFPSIDLNPPTVGNPVTYLWSALALVLLALYWLRTKNRFVLVLGIFTLITLIPVLPFPFLEHRYVYLPILSSAVILGFLASEFLKRWGKPTLVATLSALVFGVIAIGNGWALNQSLNASSEWARTLRVPFRDIERQNPTFPPDTLLFFIDPITPTEGGLSGMFFLRYGKDVTVRNWTQPVDLRDHNAAFVYYFDEQRRPQQIAVDKNAVMRSSIALPVNFESSISLDAFAVAQTTLKRGEPIVLILDYNARAPIDQDYTEFVHLVAPDGTLVAQIDQMPRKNTFPTSAWKPGMLAADAILIPTDQIPVGAGYTLELGWYAADTQQRLAIVDANGKRIADSITLESLTIIE